MYNPTEQISKLSGKVGLYYKNLITGEEYKYHADDIFQPASVIKLPIFMYISKLVSEGKAHTNSTWKTRNTIKFSRNLPIYIIYFMANNGGGAIHLFPVFSLMVEIVARVSPSWVKIVPNKLKSSLSEMLSAITMARVEINAVNSKEFKNHHLTTIYVNVSVW